MYSVNAYAPQTWCMLPRSQVSASEPGEGDSAHGDGRVEQDEDVRVSGRRRAVEGEGCGWS